MKIAYIGIDLFFPVLCELKKRGCEIEEIFTCETDNVTEFNVKILDFAKENNIHVTTKRITSDDIERLKRKNCLGAVCGGYYYRIPVDEDFPIINIHPSLLPLGRGSWPMPISIIRRDLYSGVTFHKIAEGFDTGDILMQERFMLADNENLETFMAKACKLAVGMAKKLADNFDELYKNAVPQGDGEYLAAPTEDDWTITPDMEFEDADLILRAFYGYECVYRAENKKYTLIGAKAVKCDDYGDKTFEIRDGYIEPGRIYKEIDV